MSGEVPGKFVGRAANDGVRLKPTVGANRVNIPDGLIWSTAKSTRSALHTGAYSHPNTIRYRLRRIEERTRRSLAEPRQLAELCLAFEVYRHTS